MDERINDTSIGFIIQLVQRSKTIPELLGVMRTSRIRRFSEADRGHIAEAAHCRLREIVGEWEGQLEEAIEALK